MAEWKFQGSADDPYTVSLRADGRLSCTCRGWTIKRPGKGRSCKHTREVIGTEGYAIDEREDGEFVTGSTGVKTAPAPKPAPAPATRLPRIKPSRCKGAFDERYLESDDWIAEPKLDGGRYMLYLEGSEDVYLYSRRDFPRVDKAANVPQFARTYPGLVDTILDGEVMLPTQTKLGDTTGILNSTPANAIARQRTEGLLHYHVFDMLVCNGTDIRHLPLRERRLLLEKVVEHIREFTDTVTLVTQHADKQELFDRLVAAGGEGTVLKHLDSHYGVNWVKCKRVADVSCIISGFKPGEGKYVGSLGAVALSVYKDGKLVEVGFASGMTDRERDAIWTDQKKWLGRVIDVTAQEYTPGGRLRHPRWLRERDDVSPKTVTLKKLVSDMENARRA